MFKLLSQSNWRQLVVAQRQAIRRQFAVTLAPRISHAAKAEPPVIIAGLFSQACGLGAAARSCYRALEASGLPVYGIDLTTGLRYEQNLTEFKYVDGSAVTGKGTVLLHVNGPLIPTAMLQLGRDFVRSKRIIGHWFWELPKLPHHWRSAIPFVHDVFVNTRYVADAVSGLSERLPVHIVPYPLSPAANTRTHYSKSNGVFTALFVFNILSNFERKNPCGAIKAFRLAFRDDPHARLIIKYISGEKWPESVRRMQAAAEGSPNIELVGDMLSEDSMNALYDRADVVLSLHRAEGLGLVIAEAMLRGLPVIATNFSGNADFLTAGMGIPIGYDLIPVVDPQGDYAASDCVWADPHIDEAAAALRALRADQDRCKRLGTAGAAFAADFFSPARYVDKLKSETGLAH